MVRFFECHMCFGGFLRCEMINVFGAGVLYLALMFIVLLHFVFLRSVFRWSSKSHYESSALHRMFNIVTFSTAIRQAISKALVAYYQKCEFHGLLIFFFVLSALFKKCYVVKQALCLCLS